MLTKPVILCVNRGGQSLETAKMVSSAVGWPVIGTDPRDLHLVDAGSAIVGFGFQIVTALDLSQTGSCAADPTFTAAVSTEPTLAASFEFASTSLEKDAAKPARHLQLSTASVSGAAEAGTGARRLHWTDVNGNLFTFVQFDDAGLQGKRGGYYKQLLERRGFKGKGGKLDNPMPLVGITLLVSDLGASRAFYEETLGMKVVDHDRKDVSLDAGNIILRLRPETATGMVRRYTLTLSLRDQFSFYTPDIRAEARNLVGHGVVFARGIEWSVSGGGLAKFSDPDGYNLWLWQPQPRHLDPMPINYVPVVSRILKEVGVPLPKSGYEGPFIIEQVALPNPPPPPPGPKAVAA